MRPRRSPFFMGSRAFEGGIITGRLLRIARFRFSFVVRLFSFARGLVVASPLEPSWQVLLLDVMPRVVVRVLVALPVTELAEARVAGGLLEVERDGVRRRCILGGPAEGGDHAVGLGGP